MAKKQKKTEEVSQNEFANIAESFLKLPPPDNKKKPKPKKKKKKRGTKKKDK